jgi:hypothetical protein
MLHLQARQRDQKAFHHRKKLQAAVKLAKQLECRRLASRLKKLTSEPSPDLATVRSRTLRPCAVQPNTEQFAADNNSVRNRRLRRRRLSCS